VSALIISTESGMSSKTIKISLVVATLGRAAELGRLFQSLSSQTRCDFEVILVDQNADNRLEGLTEMAWPFEVNWIRRPDIRGLSRARNIGWKAGRGELVIFPDDDCWYPPWLLSRGVDLLLAKQADVLTGRAADEQGYDINGRYARNPHRINRSNVWISGIEWVMLFRRSALNAVGGFDEDVGVGASSPWQACEGQEILLRALDKGLCCQFEPAFYGHHPRFEEIAAKAMQTKGRAYGRGLGYVLRLHHYGHVAAANWIGRPLVRVILSAVKADWSSCAYFFNVSLGRLEGYIGRTLLNR
jgi:glycosyltransferase involved in cell wall biosynthesis